MVNKKKSLYWNKVNCIHVLLSLLNVWMCVLTINYTFIINRAIIFDIRSLVIAILGKWKQNLIFCIESSKVYDIYALVMRNVLSVLTW